MEQEARDKYISILSSSLALIRQQCKIEWIKYGDDCTRFFFARAKQRKLATYIFTIQDATGAVVEGFDQVGDVMLSFYKDLLRQTSLQRHPIDPSIVSNYLWGGTEEHTKVPHILWANTCKAKKHRGTGIKDYVAWNKATIAKLVWAIATKNDTLWVEWVHDRYIKDTDWSDYASAPDSSWTWKKICSTRETFKPGCHNSHDWQFQGRNLKKIPISSLSAQMPSKCGTLLCNGGPSHVATLMRT
ncbi:hypothetical protein Cgig2_009623 [Carnegiea gigantea]|uniref:Uncharacterized protein n=1 Tax=Carnegiea gigantea TaxID=171969 RepID=A0A9Q1JVB2_9CARY|nr:hypothetical protein Cgig2_009623 [Carnegiea gigantea]